MKITLDGVSKGDALPLTTLSFETGHVSVVGVETARRPTVLGLVASGRMRPATGTVTVNGAKNYRTIRAAIALIDAPDVSEPSGEITLAGVTAEELMFAGRASSPWTVIRTLRELGVDAYAHTSMADLPPAIRLRTLTELALLRPGIRGLVLTSPDRHGGEPAEWLGIADDLASRGMAVLIIAGRASTHTLSSATQEAAPEMISQ